MTVGTAVTWTNTGRAPHTTTAGTSGNLTGEWRSDRLGSGETFTFTFQQVGSFQYFCELHPSMQATLTVVAEGASASPVGTPTAAAATAGSDSLYD